MVGLVALGIDLFQLTKTPCSLISTISLQGLYFVMKSLFWSVTFMMSFTYSTAGAFDN